MKKKNKKVSPLPEPVRRYLRTTPAGELWEKRLTNESASVSYPYLDSPAAAFFNILSERIAEEYFVFSVKSKCECSVLSFHLEVNNSSLTLILRGYHGECVSFCIQEFDRLVFSIPEWSLQLEKKRKHS